MHLLVTDPAPIKHCITFVLSLRFMSGDADAYEVKEFECSEDAATRCVSFLTALMALPRYGGDDCHRRLIGDTWKALPNADVVDGFHSWKDAPSGYSSIIEWGSDSTCNDFAAALDDFEVSWYDGNGVRYLVSVVP